MDDGQLVSKVYQQEEVASAQRELTKVHEFVLWLADNGSVATTNQF